MLLSIRVMSALLIASFQMDSAIAKAEPPPEARCQQEFWSVDDQADSDVRDVGQRIDPLESELGDTAIASGDPGCRTVYAQVLRPRKRSAPTSSTSSAMISMQYVLGASNLRVLHLVASGAGHR